MEFEIIQKVDGTLARAGIIRTPHGDIQTPAFVTVGTKATVKALTPVHIQELEAQVVLANTYHLYLQPGQEIIKAAGGFGTFMNWHGPTMTDSGGFQAFSLGAAFGTSVSKVATGESISNKTEIENFNGKKQMARITDDGVEFRSFLDGSKHFFTPERSMEIQWDLGADMIFAFDECTSPHADFSYQKRALDRTYRWAERCIARHEELDIQKVQALFGVVQGGRFQELREEAAHTIGALPFDGFGIGGSFNKDDLGSAVGWVNAILPEGKPRHLLGIGEPLDLFDAVEQGCDLFDCIAPTRMGRHGTLHTTTGKINLKNRKFTTDFAPIEIGCTCYTCTNHTRSYLAHLFRADEMLAGTLASIHNLHFILRLVEKMREAILEGNFLEYKKEFIAGYKK
jgi:queuine tRNA-ribosyltransferase